MERKLCREKQYFSLLNGKKVYVIGTMHRRQQKNEYIYVIITKLTMFGIVRTETKYIIQLEESNKKTLNVFNDTGN